LETRTRRLEKERSEVQTTLEREMDRRSAIGLSGYQDFNLKKRDYMNG
jgi:hypothetical protein